MKKSLLALSLTVLLFSCKKEKTETDFTATDVTGTTVVRGTVSKPIITPNGSGGWMNTARIPAANVVVQIKVNKNALYPNSIAQGADVYSGVTDANGNYAITVKSTANGVNANWTIVGFTGTQDTVVNGVTKVGMWANYFGTNNNVTLVMGQDFNAGHYNFNATNLSSNPNTILIGSAIVSGSVSLRHISKAVTTGTAASVVFGTTNTPCPAGATVYMTLDKDPTTLATKWYTTTTDANGRYTFTFPTVAAGTAGYNQDGVIWVADRSGSQDTVQSINAGATTIISGKTGVHQSVSNNQFGLYSNENRNATNLAQNVFTPN